MGVCVVTLQVGHKNRIIGCFINPFSEYQLYSYSCDGEIRLWDVLDGGCIKVARIDEFYDFLEIIAHPTEPDCLFVAGVYGSDERKH